MCNQLQSALPNTLVFTDKNYHLQKYTQSAFVYTDVNQLGNTELLHQYKVEKTVVGYVMLLDP